MCADLGESCATPVSIAEALQRIASVSKGETSKITIIGDNDLGFLAAFCEYFMGLKIELRGPQDAVFYTTLDEFDPQVTLVFNGATVMIPLSRNASALRTVEKTYVLENGSSFFSLNLTHINFSFASGRVPWDRLFATVFGPDFEELIERHL